MKLNIFKKYKNKNKNIEITLYIYFYKVIDELKIF